MTEFHCLELPRLERFLERRRASPIFLEMNLSEVLVAILRKANEFVPSEAGSILLDNPKKKLPDRHRNNLTFIATFGEKAERLVGQTVSADQGVGGHVYITGKSYRTVDLQEDEFFNRDFADAHDYRPDSLVAIPIRIEQEVCGVLELINRREAGDYRQQDVNLLEIFAGYISVSIQNVLDGRLAQEIAKRDNLTGLYNDRYLHIALSRAIEDCREKQVDLSLLFLDLDYFKRVNDSHGHLAGSQVLREVGQLLQGMSQGAGALAARYGGDEFVIAAPGLDLEEAIDLAEEMRQAVVSTTFCEQPGEVQPDVLRLTGQTCSIGIASLNRHASSEQSTDRCKSTLLRLSDAAMYVAKETGRNRTAVSAELVQRTQQDPSRFD
ncbi:MAG: diguanylate cyclase [Nitrospirae bacterium]|nr:diguanylate cyclase [Nitrospirota bacterium]